MSGSSGYARRYERGYKEESGKRGLGDGALEVLKARCEVRTGTTRILELYTKSAGTPAVLWGAMNFLWVVRWRS